jgi:PA14 domain
MHGAAWLARFIMKFYSSVLLLAVLHASCSNDTQFKNRNQTVAKVTKPASSKSPAEQNTIADGKGVQGESIGNNDADANAGLKVSVAGENNASMRTGESVAETTKTTPDSLSGLPETGVVGAPTPVSTEPPVVVASPTVVPSVTPTAVPSVTPTAVPSVTPTAVPSVTPTAVPVVCDAGDLGTLFNGYKIKGGDSVEIVSAQVQASKNYQVVFNNSQLLTYSQGKITAKPNVIDEVTVTGEVSKLIPAGCKAKFSVVVIPDKTIATGTMTERGVKGNLYQLPVNTLALPDFSKMTSIGKVYAPNFDIPARDFSAGFPGVTTSLVEWFAIDFTGTLILPASGNYEFKLLADDGAIFYVDGKEVVNHDGQHAPSEKYSLSVPLTAGEHPIKLKYFQGPKFQIALQLYYKGPNVSSWTIVPQSMLKVD